MSSLFDILVMSEFFKIVKCTKFVRNWVSPKNHPKFDILVMSEFFKMSKWAKFVRNWVSPKNHPKFDILVMSEFYNIFRCFWCNAAKFTQKIKVPIVFWFLVGDPSMGTLIFFGEFQGFTPKHLCILSNNDIWGI